MPIIPTPFRGEQGDLRLNISITKLATPAKNGQELGQALINEYNSYYNSPIIGKYLLGHNTEIIQEVEEHSARRATPFTKEEKQEQIDLIMANRGYPTITEFDHFVFNDIDWVRYTEVISRAELKKYVFSTLLEQGFYLMVEFYLNTNMSDNSKPWYKDADAAVLPLMQGIRLERLNNMDQQDNLLAAPE